MLFIQAWDTNKSIGTVISDAKHVYTLLNFVGRPVAVQLRSALAYLQAEWPFFLYKQ